MMKKHKFASLVAVGLAGTFALAACSGDSGGEGGGDAAGDDSCTAADASAASTTDFSSASASAAQPASFSTSSTSARPASAESGDLGTITLGYLPSWTDGLSMAHLAQDQLEKLGYTVEFEELTDAGPLYAGLAQGDVDVYPSAWPEVTHAEYMEQYGDKLEDLGAYYEGAVLTIAVPTYMEDINSIEDLAGCGDRFDGQIIGIEPGAGLTAATEAMIPEYGLEDEYELVTSSTAGMLTELDTAYQAEEDIVVTLWRPFWAYADWDMKDLEDPKGAMGEPETLNFIATAGFSEEFPEAAELFGQIKLDDTQYGTLEGLVTSDEYEDDAAGAVDQWISENGDQFDWIQE